MKSAKLTERINSYNLTDFQKKVLLATLTIKRGQVKTYKGIAEQIGHRNAYRAVGTALRKNPLPIIIPCHRVIKSDGTLGKYSNGDTGRKRMLLAREGFKINA
jgi:methylated-DNA-[protein]-cysteine S-methyltransferase